MVLKLVLHFDGSCSPNPGSGGCGSVCCDEHGVEVFRESRSLGSDCTSNIAEYSGLIMGMRRIIREMKSVDPLKKIKLEIVGDSQLVINQMTGEFRINNKRLKIYNAVAKGVVASFAQVTFRHISREQNTIADSLANKAVDRRLSRASICVYYPNLCAISHICVDGQRIATSNDLGTSAITPQILIDAEFLRSLPSFGGLKALASLDDPSPWSVLVGKTRQNIVGILRKPLTIDLMKYGQIEELEDRCVIEDAVVVERLPVPLHISFSHPAVPFPEMFSFGGDGHPKFEASSFPQRYRHHPYWVSDVHFLAIGFE